MNNGQEYSGNTWGTIPAPLPGLSRRAGRATHGGADFAGLPWATIQRRYRGCPGARVLGKTDQLIPSLLLRRL